MGRGDDKIARQQNTQAFGTGAAQEGQAFGNETGAIGDFRNRLTDIFQNNPWTDPQYLANLRSTAATVEHGAQNREQSQLQDYSARTGDNAGDITSAVQESGREASRRQHEVQTSAALDDYQKRQQQLMSATSMLGSIPGMYQGQAGLGANLMGTGAGNMTTMAGQGSWYDNFLNGLVAAGGTVGAAAAGGGGKGCWIAEALFGELDPRTLLLRTWLNGEFQQTMMGSVVMKLYLRYGQSIAAQVRRSKTLATLLRPLFLLGLKKAQLWQGGLYGTR